MSGPAAYAYFGPALLAGLAGGLLCATMILPAVAATRIRPPRPSSSRGNFPISPPAWRMKKRRAGPMASTMPKPRSRRCRSGAMSLENSRFSASVDAARAKESNRRQRS